MLAPTTASRHSASRSLLLREGFQIEKVEFFPCRVVSPSQPEKCKVFEQMCFALAGKTGEVFVMSVTRLRQRPTAHPSLQPRQMFAGIAPPQFTAVSKEIDMLRHVESGEGTRKNTERERERDRES